MKEDDSFAQSCPTPIGNMTHILMAHGGGGRLMHQLLDSVILPAIDNSALKTRHDASVIELNGVRLAFTTDSYVVKPIFFPGGDIGSLAVNGTINDLAMAGARPLFLSLGLIIEEGFPVEDLTRLMRSIKEAAEKTGVEIITGDTKVVDRGKGDGIFVNTAGIGIIERDLNICPRSVAVGDMVILSGDVGRHGIAIMAQREGLAFETTIQSDCAPLNRVVQRLLDAEITIHCLRDLTRGGLASALVEIAQTAGLGIQLKESNIAVSDEVHGACEILGLDPLYVANEGRFVVFVPESEVNRALSIMKSDPVSSNPQIIGNVESANAGMVTMTTLLGSNRIIDMLTGEQLPRIC